MGLLRTRRFWQGAGLFVAVVLAVAAYAFPPYPAPLNWLFDILALAFTLVGGLLIISQIVLPVQTRGERRASFDHFMNYVSGNAGPIIFVKDGQMVGRKEELKRYGHGVALVDPVSAIVFERAAAYKSWFPATSHDNIGNTTPRPGHEGPPLVRAAGPGIVFIQPGERVVATLDLRRQSRGTAAKGLTRDGIEVTAFVSVAFGLDPDPDGLIKADEAPAERVEHNLPAYQFNRRSAFRAVYGVAQGERQPVEWTDLPLTVAVERYRDVLAEFSLDELFQPTKPDVYPFNTFRDRVSKLAKEAPVLRDRGLIVYSVGVGGMTLPREVVNQRVRSWQARWQKATIQQEAAGETQTLRTQNRWQTDAQQLIFRDIQALLGATDDAMARRALTLMLQKALRRAAASPAHRARLPAETLKALDGMGEGER
jgi:hypothetical protein